MSDNPKDYLERTVHDFKTNLSRYIRDLEAGAARAIILKRYNQKIAIFMLIDRKKCELTKSTPPPSSAPNAENPEDRSSGFQNNVD